MELDARALETHFTVVRKDEDPARSEITWLLKAKRRTWAGVDLGGGGDYIYRATFHDGEGIELGKNELQLEPRGEVRAGATVRATLRLGAVGPGARPGDILERVKRIVLRGPAEDEGHFPRHVTFDLKVLEDRFTVLETTYDPGTNAVTWLLQARADTSAGGLEGNYWARFHDADDVPVSYLALQFNPFGELKKGTRTRATVSFNKPFAGSVLKETKKVVIEKR